MEEDFNEDRPEKEGCCPECGSELRKRGGEVYCPKCGLVIE